MQSKYKKITRRKSSKRTTRKSRINKNKSSKTRRAIRRTTRRTYRTKRRHTKNKIHRKYKGGCGGQGRGLGQAWNGGDIAKLPGVSGPHDGNYYEYKGVPSGMYDPPMPSNSQFQNGGGVLNLLPQDLVNFGRSLTGGLEGAYDGYKGEPRFDSTYPLPIDQPSMDREIQTQVNYKPLNLDKIHMKSINSVSNM
jgi:hypothetical protein